MPLRELPSRDSVPYRVLPDRINPAYGSAKLLPSLTMKVCRFIKPVPSVLTLNTAPPLGGSPAYSVVPYKVLPDKINPAYGRAVLLPPSKVCRFVKPVPSVLTLNTVPPPPELPPKNAVPYSVLPDKITPACG